MDTVDGTARTATVDQARTTIGCALTLGELRTANIARASEWNPTGKDLGGPFAACELAGEVGEAVEAMLAALGLVHAMGAICNATKKAERARAGIAGGVDAKVDLGRELADVVICADLVAMRLGINLGAAIVEKFNLTSRERGFRTRLNGVAAASHHKRQRDVLLELLRRRDKLTRFAAGIDTDGQDNRENILGAMVRDCRAYEGVLRSVGIDTERFEVDDSAPLTDGAAEMSVVQRDALLAVNAANSRFTDVVAARGAVTPDLEETEEFKACMAAEARCREVGIDTETWELRKDGVD